MDNTLDTAGAVAGYLSDAQSPAQLGAQARYTMANAVGGQPDYEAELQRVAQRTGVPVDTVRAYPDEMKKQATLASYDFDKIAAEFPGTAKFLANQDRAAIAHDDVPALSSLEQAAKMFVSGAKYLASAPGSSSTLGGDIAAAYHGAQSGAAGAFGGIARTAGAPLSFMENFPSIGGNPLERLSEGFMGIADREAAASKAATGKSETWLGGAISSGVQSLAQNAPLMLAAFLPGGQAATLTGMASMAGGQSYQKDMADGVPHWKSALHGVSDGVIEAGTEMGPLHGLIHEMKAGTSLFSSILKNAWQENKGEQVATALQDLNDWAVNDSNKGKTFGDYLAARPEAAAQTAIATLIGAGGNVALMQGIQGAMDTASGTQRQAQQAEQSAQMLDTLQTTLQASRLLERSPETLRAYMQGLADEGVPQVFVNSAALVEAGVDLQALAQAVPSVASQIAQAQTGGDFVIPTGELLVSTVGTEFAQSLIEHARTDEGAMSRAEARVFMQDGGGAQLNAEITRVLAAHDSDAEFKAGRDALQGQILQQLNNVKRFTPEVNERYATLAASFYAVMAARTGMSVTQFSDAYKLGFSGTGAAGAGMYEQGGVTVEQKADSDFLSAKSGAGLVGGHVRDGALRISSAEVAPELRGKGEGIKLYTALIDKALASGFKVFSDSTVELDAVRMYEALKRRGYDVQRLEGGQLEDGAVYGKGATEPAFEVVSGPNILEQSTRGQIAFGDDITQQASIISMLKGADLSTFIHEGGHFFLEVQADLAARIAARVAQGEKVSDGEQSILGDMNKTLAWLGVKGTPEASALQEWITMPLEQKRGLHEQWARGFEAYAFEGKAPSMELTKMFQTFRAWLVNVYRALTKADITQTLQVELTDEVRGVMDRMLATSNQIAEAEAARGMGPLFQTAEQAGMTMDEFKAYHDAGVQATMDAVGELESRSLKDLQWAQNAKSRILKALQKKNKARRDQVRMLTTSEIMSEDIYRAWTFLTAKGGDRVNGAKPAGRSTTLDPQVDNLFEAVAKLGGLNRVDVLDAWGIDAKEKMESGLFGQPVVRKDGGLSIEAMAERLTEEGYLMPGRNGQTEAEQFEELFDDQRRGTDRYSLHHDMGRAYGEAPIAGLDLPLMAAGKLRTQDLRDTYGSRDDAVWRKLSDLRMTSDEVGISPDVVAETFGFDSADELVQRLATAENPKDLIERLTDERMLQRYGDLATPAGLERAADVAIHNEARARFVATELKALQNAMNVRAKVPGKKHTVDVLAQAAREYAESIIAQLKVRDIRPSQYAAAEVRAARAAVKESGNLAKQAEHKRNQLINMEAARAAYAAQDEVKALQKYFKKFDKRIKSIDSKYQDQIEQLLEKFDFRPASGKELGRRKSLAAWYAEQEAAGNVPDIPQALLDKAVLTSFKDATVEELRGLRDTVKQIEHQGRLKNKLLLARDRREFSAIAEEMAAGITAHGGKARPVELEGPNKAADLAEGFAAQHRKLASLFRQMDGNNDHGPLYERIGRAMNERGTMEDVMIEKATQALSDIYAPMLALRGGITGGKSKVFIREINASLTRGGRLAVALNWGNEDNRQRVMAGDKWSAGQVAAILKTLTPGELQFVNQIHEYLDTFWPEIAAKEKRLTGVEPKKVEATPYVAVAADGTQVAMRGGYYPLKYDPGRSDKTDQQEAVQAAKEMMQGLTTRATTRRGHTKERAKEVERAVRKDLNVITQHVVQVTHDLAWHEWLIDTNRLLSDQRVVGAIRDHYGKQVMATLRDGVMGIAGGNTVAQTSLEKVMLRLRSNVSRATMGMSLTTGFLQPFGLTQSMYRIGIKPVLRGAARWAGDAARMESTVGWINGKSDFMRLRNTTFNKELREIHGAVAGKSRAMQIADAGLFMMMQKMQMIADVPTWCGQYEKSMAQGLDEASAVAMADRAVLETQGGGHNKDLSEIQRKHPFLTQFYSYFSVTMNLTAEATAATDFKNPRAVAGWIGDMALLNIIPALLPSLLMYALKGGGGDDDVASWIKRLAKWQLGYLMGMVVGLREFSGVLSGFDYTGPPAGRIVVDSYKFADQAWQGEIDEPAVLALINLMGSSLGIPTAQLLRSYRGWKVWDEGKDGTGPQSVLFGPPSRD